MTDVIHRLFMLQKLHCISIRDFKQQVKQRCPLETPIPCDELVRLQFVPAHKCYRSASKYTSFLEVKKQVQQCQWRKDHEDTHYTACIFRYMCAFLTHTQSAYFASSLASSSTSALTLSTFQPKETLQIAKQPLRMRLQGISA